MTKSVRLALALLLLPGLTAAAEQPVANGGAWVWINLQGDRLPGYKLTSEEVIQFEGYSLAPPAGSGWKVLQKGPHTRGVGFGKREAKGKNLIWAASFLLALDESVDGIVRALVGQPYWRAPEGFRVLSASGSEITRHQTRCVKVSASAAMTFKKKSKSGIDYRAHCLACTHPSAKTLHVVLAFAETKPSSSSWLTTNDDAERFFDNLQFTNLATPIVESFAVPGAPFLVESLEGYLWVGLTMESTLLKIDPSSGEIAKRIDLPGVLRSATTGFGSMWVIASDGKLLLRISPSLNEVTNQVRVPPESRTIVSGAGSVWVISGMDQVTRVDPEINNVIATIEGPWRGKKGTKRTVLNGMTYSRPWLWVADGENDLVFRVDPATNQISGDPIKVGRRPRELVASGGSIWTLNALGNSVTRIDQESGEVLGEVKVEGEPLKATAHGGTLWVSSPKHHAVTQVDSRSSNPKGRPIWVGIRPAGLAINGGYLWVTNGHSDTLTKIRIGEH